jgi:hypothetical protein
MTSTTMTCSTTSVTDPYASQAITVNRDTETQEKVEKCKLRLKFAQSYLASVRNYPMITPMLFKDPNGPYPDLEHDREKWALSQVDLALRELESAQQELLNQ